MKLNMISYLTGAIFYIILTREKKRERGTVEKAHQKEKLVLCMMMMILYYVFLFAWKMLLQVTYYTYNELLSIVERTQRQWKDSFFTLWWCICINSVSWKISLYFLYACIRVKVYINACVCFYEHFLVCVWFIKKISFA